MLPVGGNAREVSVPDDARTTTRPTWHPESLDVGHATSTGRVRPTNEDSVLCEPADGPGVARRGLFCAVADGMGGHAAGDVASSISVRRARDAFYESAIDEIDRALRHAIADANASVYEAGAGTRGRNHMGSTLTAAVVFEEQMVVGHVGDSRCYLLKHGSIRQLTRDHSWVGEAVEAGTLSPDEARVHPRRNIITRALGLSPEIDVEVYVATLESGSVAVLCSDGLHGLVPDDEIERYARALPAQEAADELVALANERGGVDNISVVVLRAGAPRDAEGDTQTRLMQPLHAATGEREQAPAATRGDSAGSNPIARDPVPETPAAPAQPAPTASSDGSVQPARPRPSNRQAIEQAKPARRGIDVVMVLVMLLALALLGAAVGLSLVRSLGI